MDYLDCIAIETALPSLSGTITYTFTISGFFRFSGLPKSPRSKCSNLLKKQIGNLWCFWLYCKRKVPADNELGSRCPNYVRMKHKNKQLGQSVVCQLQRSWLGTQSGLHHRTIWKCMNMYENVWKCINLLDFLIFLTIPTGSAETLIRRGLGSALGASPALVLEQHLGSSKIIKNRYAKFVNQK